MIVEIEGKLRPRRSAVSHCPEHYQADQIIEPIAVINYRGAI